MFLDECKTLGHLLMHVCRMRGKRADQFMEQSNLFRGQGILLLILSRHDGLTHSEIAEMLDISPAAATKVIKRLEQAHYLQRMTDSGDERVSRVYLMDEGRAVINEIHKSFKRLDEITFKNFSEEELAKLRDYINRMMDNLQKIK